MSRRVLTPEILTIIAMLSNTATVYYETDGSIRICGQGVTYYIEPETE